MTASRCRVRAPGETGSVGSGQNPEGSESAPPFQAAEFLGAAPGNCLHCATSLRCHGDSRAAVPDGLRELFRDVVPEAPQRPQGGGRRRCNDRAVPAAVVFVSGGVLHSGMTPGPPGMTSPAVSRPAGRAPTVTVTGWREPLPETPPTTASPNRDEAEAAPENPGPHTTAPTVRSASPTGPAHYRLHPAARHAADRA